MKKEKLSKFDTTLLIITTLIALFFFVKWINDIRPRYEWKEEIYTTNSSYLNHYYSIDRGDDFCQKVEYHYLEKNLVDKDYVCYWAIIQENNEGKKLCTVEKKGSINVCYKKEKIRIK